MTLTPTALPAALKTAWSNVRLPQIRVAVPALRSASKPSDPAAHAVEKRELERKFRDDFVELSRMKPQSRIAPDPNAFSELTAKDMARAIRQAA